MRTTKLIASAIFLLCSSNLLSACNSPSQTGSDPSNGEASATVYVTASSLNCRSEATPTAVAVGSFKKGAAVTTIGAKDGWTHIQQNGKDCWGSSAYLSNVAPVSNASTITRKHSSFGRSALVNSTPTGVRARANHAVHRPIVRHHAVHHASSVYDFSGCPCSGRRICIGPRGGRYCITSGGNKRYGV